MNKEEIMPLPFIPVVAALAAKGAAVAGTVLASKAAIGVGVALKRAVSFAPGRKHVHGELHVH